MSFSRIVKADVVFEDDPLGGQPLWPGPPADQLSLDGLKTVSTAELS